MHELIENMKSFGASVCELCHHHQASFYCCSDSAFLCSHCDSQVHSANFLVARHIRLSLCKSSSSSTTCKSHTTTPKSNNNNNTISDWKTRDVLVNWCRKLGLGVSSSLEVIEVAIGALEVSWGVLVWPYRLLLAASLWLGLMTTNKDDNDNDDDDKKNKIRIPLLLKRLQEISGVPANSIMLAQSKLLLKMMKHQYRQHHLEEGWDETIPS